MFVFAGHGTVARARVLLEFAINPLVAPCCRSLLRRRQSRENARFDYKCSLTRTGEINARRNGTKRELHALALCTDRLSLRHLACRG